MKNRPITTAFTLLTLAFLKTSATFATDIIQQTKIIHIPIPLGIKGKPFPITVEFTENQPKLKAVKVIVKSSTDLKDTKISMISTGEGRYQAAIPAKFTAAILEMAYRIEAETVTGIKSNTPWYPVKLESIEDKVKDAAEETAPEKPGKIRKFIKQHPLITGVGAVAVIGGGIALASGGGSSGSSSTTSGGTLTADTGTAGSAASNISGTWQYINIMPYGPVYGSMNLTQNGTAVSGSFSEEGDGGSVSGSVNGNSFSMTFNFNDGTTDQLSGSVSGNQMSGTWRETDTGETGTFTATR